VSAPATLEVRGLRKVFFPGTANEVVALNGIDLEVPAGQFVTIIGSNGSGKSTLLNAVAGAIPVSGGKIVLGGRDVTKQADHAAAHVLGLLGHVATAEHDLAAADGERAGHGIQQRRFARPVGADDADELSGRRLEVDAVQGHDLVGGAGEEDLAQPAYLESSRGTHDRTTLRRTVGMESATTTSAAVSSLRSVGAMPRRRLMAISSL